MNYPFLMVTGLAMALAACGKPAEVQPEPQIAGQNPSDVAAAAPMAAADDGFPAVPSEEEVAAAAAAAGMPVTPENRVRLVCDNEEKLVVRFFPEQGIAVLVRADQSVELNQQPTGSGFQYSNDTTTLSGKGDEYTVQIGMMVPMQCVPA